jgi:hypothetical protein
MNAMVQILLHHRIEALIKWVNDFIFFHYPKTPPIPGTTPTFSYNSKLIWDIGNQLGWPWVPNKFVNFSPAFSYIRFWWDLPLKTVKLPKKKKAKYLDRLSS